MNILTIKFDDNGMRVSLKEPSSIQQLIQIYLQGILMATEQFITQAKADSSFTEKVEADVRKDFYDLINTSCSNILRTVDPSQDQAPHLSEVAILLAENQLLDRAKAQGLSLEEYLPQAKEQLEKDFELFKRNETGRKRHLKKLQKEGKL